MRSLARLALLTLLLGVALAAFANPTVTDTVGTGYSVTDAVLMIDIAGKNTAHLTRSSITVQTEAGARAETFSNLGYAEAGYLRYTAHGYTKLLKIMVESQTQGYISTSVHVGILSTKAHGSAFETLGSIPQWATEIRPVSTLLIPDISGSDTWTGTNVDSGLLLFYETSFDPGVSSFVVTYTIMEQS
jgi:hypothetical protein